jgi:formate hydrogenlyase subunit 6/NADH:ubiquinone oxidoreductase subunit I
MESITIYPKNAKQKSLLTSLLEEMKVRFEIATSNDEDLNSEKEFFAKIEKSISQAESGKTKKLSKDKQKEFLGL